MPQRRYIIVGAGQAGGHAAVTLRQAGFEGEIVLVGEETHPPYERPPLSKGYLTDKTVTRTEFHGAAKYAELNVRCLFGQRAVELDAAGKTLRLDNGEQLAWDKLLLATGGRVRRLQHEAGPVYYLRTDDDARRLRDGLRSGRRVVVVGGGVIGLEVAASASELGTQVTVIEPSERVMSRMVAPEVSRLMELVHRDRGVDLRLGTSVHAVDAAADGSALVRLTERDQPADLVVVGIGIIPNAELAAEAGIGVDDGILVDASCRTDHPDVYAVGDVANFEHPRYSSRMRLESWQNASRQAEIAARAMCGEEVRYDDIPWFWSDQFGVNMQVAGLPSLADETIFRGARDPFAGTTAFHLAGGELVALTTVNNARDMAVGRRLLASGAQIDPQLLADPQIPLKKLLKAAVA